MESNRSIGENVEDAKLLRRVGAMLDHLDPVPDAVRAAARSAFAWCDMDARLARLIDEELLVGSATRAHGEAKLLTFEAPGMTVAIEATEINGARKLIGQLVPSGPHHVALETAAQSGQQLTAPVDHLGRFTLTSVPAGLIRLRCTLPDGAQVVTEWVDT
ncbi:MAG TPA: hypothetical protein VGS97_22155 [Actinocrinis sp.]|uniref:hypothetical protein n=1 Tax=Actinocrinis sp. TaxID=1920516 RepID=UPI002DDCEFE4|nr:hypothetical protein [Actinocrinis sp.]HEV2346821.1 hypothetical protein [Actinocrinis sp.]